MPFALMIYHTPENIEADAVSGYQPYWIDYPEPFNTVTGVNVSCAHFCDGALV